MLPLHPKGLVQHTGQPLSRLLAGTLLAGLLSGAVLMLPLCQCWLPVVDEAITRTPSKTVIAQATLKSSIEGQRLLAANRFISVNMVLGPHEVSSSTSDVRLLLQEHHLRVGSIAGFIDFSYPGGYQINLDSSALMPWWTSRKPFILSLIWLVISFSLVGSWLGLALIYCLPIRWLAALFGRSLRSAKAFALGLLGLGPGAIIALLAALLYGNERLSLQEYLLAMALHWVVPWIWIVLSLRHIPLDATQDNPFTHQGTDQSSNPFL